MAALAVEVSIGVVFRTIGESLVWYDEVASILLAWLTFYGSALASVKRAHIGCPEVVAHLPRGARLALRVVAELCTIGFFLLMGWMGYRVLGVLATDYLVSLPTCPWLGAVGGADQRRADRRSRRLLTLPKVLADAARRTGRRRAH